MTIKDLGIGKTATITKVGGSGALRQHLLDMGLIQGTEVTVVQYAPLGDPVELRVRDYELSIRLEDAACIEVTSEHLPARKADQKSERPHVHPGLGEGGKYHDSANETPLPEKAQLSFALVGNQNCGKTTLFNCLTGSNQHVGNFPGVTVDQKSGVIKGHSNTSITDLPGIYSMSPYSAEEIVTREFLLSTHPKGIINILDATNIERNLYLTLQLIELGTPMVVALNMMDELTKNGGAVRINQLEELLGVPVVPISAAKESGIEELVNHALHVAKYQEAPVKQDFCEGGEERQGAVHRCIHSIMHLIEDHAVKERIPLRFAASKLAEGDSLVLEKLKLSENETEMLEHIMLQMEEESGLDRASAIAKMRFDFIQKVCQATVIKPGESVEHKRSREIDRFLTGKFTGIPAFVLIMGLVFYLTFGVIGSFFSDLLELGIGSLTGLVKNALDLMGVNAVLKSLIIDGIFGGVGSVLSFLPIIVTLFFFLSLLEDSGYMARVAFIMDKLLRKVGLSGRSIVPMLIGFGCTVPGVMASRTLSSERDRKLTILLTPFMSCSAKLPVYAFLAAAFFPRYSTLVMIGLYFGGIIMAILLAHIGKTTVFKGEPVPFVMELPNYRMPGFRNVCQLLWEKAKDFLQRAFTVIFLGTIVIWVLQTFDFRMNVVTNSKDSILAGIAGALAPAFQWMGFGDWRIVTALLSGFLAKESVVSTLSVLLGATPVTALLGWQGALSLLVFCLLYTPCIAAVAAVSRELGKKYAAIVVIGQCFLAYVTAGLVYLVL